MKNGLMEGARYKQKFSFKAEKSFKSPSVKQHATKALWRQQDPDPACLLKMTVTAAVMPGYFLTLFIGTETQKT